MREFKKITILLASLMLLFVLGQIAPVSSQEIPKPGPKPEELIKPKPIPCPPVADIRDCMILEFSGSVSGFARMRLSWTYGSGERPYKLLITVFRKQGTPPTWQNVMNRSESLEVTPPTNTSADVVIFGGYSGDYQIVFEAYYSCNRVKKYSFFRHL